MATRSDRHVARRRIADDRGVHIHFITDATLHVSGQIEVQTRGSKSPTIFRALGSTQAARQLSEGLMRSLHVEGGTWTSSATLSRQHGSAEKFLQWMAAEHEIVDLASEALTPDLVWQGVLHAGKDGGAQRNLRTFLADTLVHIRDEDGGSFRDFLYGRSLVVEESSLQGYSPEVAAAIESIARRRVGEWYVRHRAAVLDVLGDLPDDWLRLEASQLVRENLTGECPEPFRVDKADLAAAMILLALIDDQGPNLSTIQSYTCDSVERAGDDASFVTGVKARNKQVLRTPAPAGGLFSYGGLVEFVAAATRVDRLFRGHTVDFDRLLFVATGSSKVMGVPEVNAWWAGNAEVWPEPDIPFPRRVAFRRLRKAATLRSRHRGYGVIGQKRGMARLYLADAVPDVILIPGLLDTQRGVTDYWRSKIRPVDDAVIDEMANSSPVHHIEDTELLTQAGAVMDVGVAACVSNGQSPTDESKPCGLGPVACFVCPKGYRTPEVIPGLIATVEFTEDVRKFEPEEWVTGEAPILYSLAKKALDQFPMPLISAVTADEIANSKVLIACVYLEGRSNE